jgi:hypothetical protein
MFSLENGRFRQRLSIPSRSYGWTGGGEPKEADQEFVQTLNV